MFCMWYCGPFIKVRTGVCHGWLLHAGCSIELLLRNLELLLVTRAAPCLHVDAELSQTHSDALERAFIVKTISSDETLHRPVQPMGRTNQTNGTEPR